MFKNGNKLIGKYVILYYKKAEKRRVAFIVSKRIAKLAVKRNKVKRLLREAYRLHKHIIENDLEMLIIARHSTLNTAYNDIAYEVKDLFNKINNISY